MPQRQQPRLLPLIAAIAGVGVVLFVIWQFILIPVWNYNSLLASLDNQIHDKNLQIAKVMKERAALERFQLFSLPDDPVFSETEYERFLGGLVRKHGFKVETLRPTGLAVAAAPAGSKAVFGSKNNESPYTALQFHLEGKVTLAAFTAILKEFAETPLMHRIKNMTVRPVEEDSKKKKDFMLIVQMDIDALMVKGVSDRPKFLLGPDEGAQAANALTLLKGGPGLLHLLPWVFGPAGPKSAALLAKEELDYAMIDRKNIFIGFQKPPPKPPPVTPKTGNEEPVEPPTPATPFDNLDMRKYFKLVAITKSEDLEEAWLYAAAKNQFKRLKASAGYKKFIIYDGAGEKELFVGNVLKIDYGAVYFEAKVLEKKDKWSKEQVYCIHSGESIAEAIENPVPTEELIKAGIKVAKAD